MPIIARADLVVRCHLAVWHTNKRDMRTEDRGRANIVFAVKDSKPVLINNAWHDANGLIADVLAKAHRDVLVDCDLVPVPRSEASVAVTDAMWPGLLLAQEIASRTGARVVRAIERVDLPRFRGQPKAR